VLVSVLIPVYNVEAYVEDAIRSILVQTYTHLEIIIIDDCSTDRTYEICLQLRNTDSRIQIYRNESNRRISYSLNRALAESRGDLIARMDGDDISEPDRISRQVEYLLNNPGLDLVGVNLIGIDPNGHELNRFTHFSDQKSLIESMRYVTPVSHVWVARRSVYQRLAAYREIPGCEDYDFLLRMHSLGLCFSNVPDYFGYRVRIQRIGNTQAAIGLRQRMLFNYVYGLYRERERTGRDSFSPEDMARHLSTNTILDWLYRVSNQCLARAIVARSKGHLFKAATWLTGALLSPHQVQYLYFRLRYRLIKRHLMNLIATDNSSLPGAKK